MVIDVDGGSIGICIGEEQKVFCFSFRDRKLLAGALTFLTHVRFV